MMPARRTNWIPSIFNDFFGNEWLERSHSSSPAVNILENEKEYRVEIAAPGMTRDDFKIELQDDNHLVVSMEKKDEKNWNGGQYPEDTDAPTVGEDPDQYTQEDKPMDVDGSGPNQVVKSETEAEVKRNEHQYLRREFSYTSFRQSMILPDNVNVENITARVNDGVLTIEIPKTTEEEKAARAKTIEVK